MIVAVDVHYDPQNEWARVGVLLFEGWDALESVTEFVTMIGEVLPYESGAFFKRELPCIVPAINHALSLHPIETIVIDGFVDLGDNKPGLGRHLHTQLGHESEVVGVAKNGYKGAPATAITRGQSGNPLWISSTADHAQAAAHIADMAGDSRIPLLLKRTDSLARATVPAINTVDLRG
jgi:deoxyribonuclease V